MNSLGITNIFEDMQDNIWAGSIQGGVNIAASGKSFINYNNFSNGINLDIININAVEEDSKGNLWIGSFDNGINLINAKTGQKKIFINDKNKSNSLGYGTVFKIFEDIKKNIWIGTYLGFLQKYDPLSNSFISFPYFPEKGDSSEGRDIRSIIEDWQGNLWLAASGFGMSRFNPVTKKFKHFHCDVKNLNTSLADNYTFQLLFDNEKNIWVATPSGLSKFNPFTETFTNYYHNLNDSNSLCHNFVNTLFEDSRKNLWIGTTFGLDILEKSTGRFVHFFEKDGLPSNLIKCILEYKPGELWISTGNGISRMRYEKKSNGKVFAKFRNYNQSDNLQDNIFWERSGCKTSNGNLLFGCEKGIILFDPDKIIDNTEIPKVYITGIKLFNKPVLIGEYDSLLKHNINQTNEIKLKYNQNFITFNYVAINYISKENNHFAYKMEGFDPDWNYVVNKREAIYTNLDPGTYTFKVKASNNDRYWNEKGASIKLIILPPFWSNWWFRLLLIVIILSIGSSYYFFRINILNKQNLVLEKKVEERTHDLSSANSELMEKNNWIISQNEEIKSKNEEIIVKSHEINLQKGLLEEQKNKIEKAFDELSKYRNKLEEIVENRTRELIIAKDKAEESDRLKSSFLANLSHEIRTPLNAIIGFSSVIIEPYITEDDRQKYNSIIQSSSNTLLSLINDIIDFSKIEAGHLDIILREVSLSKIFSDIQEIFALEIKNQYVGIAKNVEFKVNIDEKIQSINFVTDETRLKQILTNLINNSIKFTDQGCIEVGCKLIGEKTLEFFVKDTGIGIPNEYKEIIFQRFRKIENDNIHLYRGAGLGLSISQHLVRLLGGDIRVESNYGSGSVFYFSIPFNQKAERKETIRTITSSIPNLFNYLILVAEDDYASYLYLEKLLQKTNARVLHASNGKEVIIIYESNKDIRLILMDIKMPDMNGIEALFELKRKNIQIPVIAQTAYAFYDDIKKINEAGFTDYLLKPVISNDLFKMLYKHLKVVS